MSIPRPIRKAVKRLCPAGPATDSCWFMPLRLPTGEWITPGRRGGRAWRRCEKMLGTCAALLLQRANYQIFTKQYRRRRPRKIRTCAINGGRKAPARKHHHLYLPYQIPFPAACSAISSLSKSATYVSCMSIGRSYVQPGAKLLPSGSFQVKHCSSLGKCLFLSDR